MIIEATLQRGKVLSATNINEAFAVMLKSVFDRGHSNGQLDKAHGSTGFLEFQVSIDNPQSSILTKPARHFQKRDIVAGIVWIYELNSKFEGIAYYQQIALFYSDNQISMPGSNDRRFIFESYQGFNQTERVIQALRRETNSGYGAVVIWSSQEETENCLKYIHYELTQPRLVAQLKRHARECFLLWIGLEPLRGFSDLSAALITASALFFIVHPSYMLANLTLNRLHASINQLKPFLEVCILIQNRRRASCICNCKRCGASSFWTKFLTFHKEEINGDP